MAVLLGQPQTQAELERLGPRVAALSELRSLEPEWRGQVQQENGQVLGGDEAVRVGVEDGPLLLKVGDVRGGDEPVGYTAPRLALISKLTRQE